MGVRHPPELISVKDAASLANGNATMRSTLQFVRAFHKHLVPWCLGNPASSNMWAVPELQAFIRRDDVVLIDVDQCSFGQPSRKRTKLCFGHCNAEDVRALERRCRCSGRKVCDFQASPTFSSQAVGRMVSP